MDRLARGLLICAVCTGNSEYGSSTYVDEDLETGLRTVANHIRQRIGREPFRRALGGDVREIVTAADQRLRHSDVVETDGG